MASGNIPIIHRLSDVDVDFDLPEDALSPSVDGEGRFIKSPSGTDYGPPPTELLPPHMQAHFPVRQASASGPWHRPMLVSQATAGRTDTLASAVYTSTQPVTYREEHDGSEDAAESDRGRYRVSDTGSDRRGQRAGSQGTTSVSTDGDVDGGEDGSHSSTGDDDDGLALEFKPVPNVLISPPIVSPRSSPGGARVLLRQYTRQGTAHHLTGVDRALDDQHGTTATALTFAASAIGAAQAGPPGMSSPGARSRRATLNKAATVGTAGDIVAGHPWPEVQAPAQHFNSAAQLLHSHGHVRSAESSSSFFGGAGAIPAVSEPSTVQSATVLSLGSSAARRGPADKPPVPGPAATMVTPPRTGMLSGSMSARVLTISASKEPVDKDKAEVEASSRPPVRGLHKALPGSFSVYEKLVAVLGRKQAEIESGRRAHTEDSAASTGLTDPGHGGVDKAGGLGGDATVTPRKSSWTVFNPHLPFHSHSPASPPDVKATGKGSAQDSTAAAGAAGGQASAHATPMDATPSEGSRVSGPNSSQQGGMSGVSAVTSPLLLPAAVHGGGRSGSASVAASKGASQAGSQNHSRAGSRRSSVPGPAGPNGHSGSPYMTRTASAESTTMAAFGAGVLDPPRQGACNASEVAGHGAVSYLADGQTGTSTAVIAVRRARLERSKISHSGASFFAQESLAALTPGMFDRPGPAAGAGEGGPRIGHDGGAGVAKDLGGTFGSTGPADHRSLHISVPSSGLASGSGPVGPAGQGQAQRGTAGVGAPNMAAARSSMERAVSPVEGRHVHQHEAVGSRTPRPGSAERSSADAGSSAGLTSPAAGAVRLLATTAGAGATGRGHGSKAVTTVLVTASSGISGRLQVEPDGKLRVFSQPVDVTTAARPKVTSRWTAEEALLWLHDADGALSSSRSAVGSAEDLPVTRDFRMHGASWAEVQQALAELGQAGQEGLRSLSLTACGLTAAHIALLPSLPKLRSLDLSDNPLADLLLGHGQDGHESTTGPAHEDKKDDDAGVTDGFRVTWLSKFPGLAALALRGCGLHAVPSFRGLQGRAVALQLLDLSCNQLASLDGLEILGPSLRTLDLSLNDISTTASLRPLGSLLQLDDLSMHPNPVTLTTQPSMLRAALNTLLPELLVLDGAHTAHHAAKRKVATRAIASAAAAASPKPGPVQRKYGATSRAGGAGLASPNPADSARLGSTMSAAVETVAVVSGGAIFRRRSLDNSRPKADLVSPSRRPGLGSTAKRQRPVHRGAASKGITANDFWMQGDGQSADTSYHNPDSPAVQQAMRMSALATPHRPGGGMASSRQGGMTSAGGQNGAKQRDRLPIHLETHETFAGWLRTEEKLPQPAADDGAGSTATGGGTTASVQTKVSPGKGRTPPKKAGHSTPQRVPSSMPAALASSTSMDDMSSLNFNLADSPGTHATATHAGHTGRTGDVGVSVVEVGSMHSSPDNVAPSHLRLDVRGDSEPLALDSDGGQDEDVTRGGQGPMDAVGRTTTATFVSAPDTHGYGDDLKSRATSTTAGMGTAYAPPASPSPITTLGGGGDAASALSSASPAPMPSSDPLSPSAWLSVTRAKTTAFLAGLKALMRASPWADGQGRGTRDGTKGTASSTVQSVLGVIRQLVQAGLLGQVDLEEAQAAGQPGTLDALPLHDTVLLEMAATDLESRAVELFSGLQGGTMSATERSAAIAAASEWVTARCALVMYAQVLLGVTTDGVNGTLPEAVQQFRRALLRSVLSPVCTPLVHGLEQREARHAAERRALPSQQQEAKSREAPASDSTLEQLARPDQPKDASPASQAAEPVHDRGRSNNRHGHGQGLFSSSVHRALSRDRYDGRDEHGHGVSQVGNGGSEAWGDQPDTEPHLQHSWHGAGESDHSYTVDASTSRLGGPPQLAGPGAHDVHRGRQLWQVDMRPHAESLDSHSTATALARRAGTSPPPPPHLQYTGPTKAAASATRPVAPPALRSAPFGYDDPTVVGVSGRLELPSHRPAATPDQGLEAAARARARAQAAYSRWQAELAASATGAISSVLPPR